MDERAMLLARLEVLDAQDALVAAKTHGPVDRALKLDLREKRRVWRELASGAGPETALRVDKAATKSRVANAS